MEYTKGTSNFQSKARIISVLGEQLIKDASIGIIELVKNGYDADATEVKITLTALNKENALIEILDNGTGMDLDTFLSKWMNPASGHKEELKQKGIRTKRGRLPLGEKGVGRFAAQKIGNKLRIITKVKKTNKELYVLIDWKEFTDSEKNLSDIEINYEERENEFFKPDESGTLLQIFDLKEQFSENDLRKISSTLRRLKSPFKGASDFNLLLEFKDSDSSFLKYSNLEISDILEKSHYKLIGIIDENGILDYNYDFNLPNAEIRNETDRFDLSQFTNVKKLKRPFICGPFMVNFYNYDRTPEIISTSKINTKELDEVCGVSIFRDGIRLFPYGEKGDDWLGLDKRRIQDPTKKIDNNTIIGLVEINQVDNRFLIDKTNREGLIENSAFEYFHELVLGCIMFLEELKSKDKPKKEKKKVVKNVKEEIKEDINDIKKNIDEIKESIKNDKDEKAIKNKEIIENVSNSVIKIESDINAKLIEDEESRKTLLNLSGTGLAAERFTHEFEMLINGILNSLKKLAQLIDVNSSYQIKQEFANIHTGLDAIRNDIRLLGPMFYFKRSTKEKDLSIHNIIQTVIDLQSSWLKKYNIKCNIYGNNFKVYMREGLCAQIFNNLLDNSIYWVSHKTETDTREINFILNESDKTVYVTDSGPGVTTKFKDKIFDLFFTMKSDDGRGLGLWIVNEILNDGIGSINLVDKDSYKNLLTGASFKVTFSC